jgi:hypothetical protein
MIQAARRAAGSNTDELRSAAQNRSSTVKLPVFSELMDKLEEELWTNKEWEWSKNPDKGVNVSRHLWAYSGPMTCACG